MKKTIAGALTAVILLSNILSAEAKLGAEAVYSSSDFLITVNGKAELGKNITMVFQPYDIESNKLNLDEANNGDAVFYMTTTDKNGDYSVQIGIPAGWNEGIYKALAYQEEYMAESWFMYADITDAELTEINSADATKLKGMLADFGVTGELNDEYADNVSKLLVINRPQNGYTKDGFLKELISDITINMVKTGNLNITSAVEKLSLYLEIESDEFAALSDNVKSETERLVKQLEVDSAVSDYLKKCLLIAKINKAESVEALQKLITVNSAILGINLAQYNALPSDYSKAQVFEKMIGKSYQNYNEIKSSFEAFVPVGNVIVNSPSGGGGGSSGGSSGSYGGSYSTDGTVVESGFSDMKGHWAENQVKELAARNIVNGFPNGKFMPEQSVTRAEFSKMICLAMNITSSGDEVSFNDVSEDEWYSEYIKILACNRIVTGFGDNTFRPNDNISRQDAAVIVWRMLKNSVADKNTEFLDETEIADYAKEAVSQLSGLGIINGYDGRFRPNNNITRAEAAKILFSVINK